mgnify:CR=1 FL=1
MRLMGERCNETVLPGIVIESKLFVIFLLVIIANFVANLFYRHEVKNLIEFYNVSQTEHYRVNKIYRIFKKTDKVEAG